MTVYIYIYMLHVVELEVLFLEPQKSPIPAVLLPTDSLESHLEKRGPVPGNQRRADENGDPIVAQIPSVDQGNAPRTIGQRRNSCRSTRRDKLS